jgi:hypothetical protein
MKSKVPAQSWRFIVNKSKLGDCKVVDGPSADPVNLADGAILIQVDRISLTANNILYAVLGERLHYWDLFPAPDGFGVIPAWGFGDVIASRHPEIEVGERLFGCFPMGSHATLEPADVARGRFRDGAAHRAAAAAPYNEYQRIGGDPAFEGRQGDYLILLRPLFLVSWLASIYFSESAFFGAQDFIITSASSKTATALAYLLRKSGAPIDVIGLTSTRNVLFAKKLDYYDHVVSYDNIDELEPDRTSVLFDVAGDGELKARIHALYGNNLRHSAQVGLAHWDAPAPTTPLSGPAPTRFFGPDHMGRLIEKWGVVEFEKRRRAASLDFINSFSSLLSVRERRATDGITDMYLEVLNGHVPPDVGYVLVMS